MELYYGKQYVYKKFETNPSNASILNKTISSFQCLELELCLDSL